MKTQLDLYNSANAAAAKTLKLNTTFEVESAALETFRAEKQDARDWPSWKSTFDHQRTLMLNMSVAKALSEAGKN